MSVIARRFLPKRSPSVTTAISSNNGRRLPPHSPPVEMTLMGEEDVEI
ncbi:MAG TPA: hypothetical protein VKA34_23880 [Balneolales bacterium]|nr:hypothetical protein [Balneolales bacterium]